MVIYIHTVFVNGNEVDRLTTGDFFGEVALTVSKQRTADVKSLGNTSTHSKSAKSSESVELFQVPQCVAARCSVLQRVAAFSTSSPPSLSSSSRYHSVLQRVAACCSVLQRFLPQVLRVCRAPPGSISYIYAYMTYVCIYCT